jgi:hypothetical protein
MVWKNSNSDQRFAYEAQYIIETKDNTIPEEFPLQEVLMLFRMKLLLLLKWMNLRFSEEKNERWSYFFDKVE